MFLFADKLWIVGISWLLCEILNETLRSDYRHKLRSLHHRVLRAAVIDFKQKMPKITLDQKWKRVNPRIWSLYFTSSLVIKAIRDRSPILLYEMLNETIHTTRQQSDKARFYDNLKGKVGKHRLCNRLHEMNDLPEWLNIGMTDDAIRRFLKTATILWLWLNGILSKILIALILYKLTKKDCSCKGMLLVIRLIGNKCFIYLYYLY